MTRPADPLRPGGPWRIASRLCVVGAELASAKTIAERLGTIAGLDRIEALAASLGTLPQRRPENGVDLLVCDARTVIAPADVEELRRAAETDPMIAAVSPRFAKAEGATPAVRYVLLPDARCVYVKGSVLDAFAPADGQGPATLDALLLALNRFGFRIAVATRATAHHPGGDAPATATVAPAWRAAHMRHLRSAPVAADAMMDQLSPGPDGRRRIAFDLAHLRPAHSGTTRLTQALIRCAAARWDDLALSVIATREAFAFHLGALENWVTRVDPGDRNRFAAVIRLGQPFLWKEMEATARRAPVIVVFMLDTIGLDCLHDAPDELDALWRFIFAEADGVLFNSAFTQRQFESRFALRPGLARRTSLHSLDLVDFRNGDALRPPPAAPSEGVLVVGNTMPHKHLRETAALLAGAGLAGPVTVLGLAAGSVPGAICLPSGSQDTREVAALYAGARVIVYPSVYEGFGFPILEALAHGKPILVRPLPPFAEIAARLPEAANIHIFEDDTDLLRLARDPPTWSHERAPVPVRTWAHAAADLRAVLDESIAGASHARVVRRIDLLRGRMAYMRGRAFATPGVDEPDDLERLAAAAGRLVQDCVGTIGRRVPGGRALLGGAERVSRVLRRRR